MDSNTILYDFLFLNSSGFRNLRLSIYSYIFKQLVSFYMKGCEFMSQLYIKPHKTGKPKSCQWLKCEVQLQAACTVHVVPVRSAKDVLVTERNSPASLGQEWRATGTGMFQNAIELPTHQTTNISLKGHVTRTAIRHQRNLFFKLQYFSGRINI